MDDAALIAKLAHCLRICDKAAPRGKEYLAPAILGTLLAFGNVAIARMATLAYLNHPGTASPAKIAAWVYAALETDMIYPDSPTFHALCAAYEEKQIG